MAEERVDTNPDIFPIGPQVLVCNKVLKKLSQNSNKPYYLFDFDGMVDGELKNHKEMRFPSQCGDLILALGGKPGEKKGEYIWDREKVVGNKIKVTMIHEPDFKDKTKTRARITEPVQELPF